MTRRKTTTTTFAIEKDDSHQNESKQQRNHQDVNLLSVENSSFAKDTNPTPSRFLLESGAYNFTPGLLTSMAANNDLNPFEASFNPAGTGSMPKSSFNNHQPPSSVKQKKKVSIQEESINDNHEILNHFHHHQHHASNDLNEDSEDEQGERRRDSDSEDSIEGDDETRRVKFLKKNRAAASRCRQKKKEWLTELEKKADDVSKRNEELATSVRMLREELISLKNKLLAHKDCNCNIIQKYIHSSGQFSYLLPSNDGAQVNRMTSS